MPKAPLEPRRDNLLGVIAEDSEHPVRAEFPNPVVGLIVRWFATEELAEEWLARHQAKYRRHRV